MELELTTERVIPGGDMLARADDGRVVMVEGALPKERVKVEITTDRADHMLGHVVEVVEASPDRVEMPCAHAREGCGGCGWLHITPDAQPDLKREILADALRRIARVEDAPFRDTVRLPAQGFRTTVRAMVVDGRAAFRKRAAHDPVLIETCLVAHPLVDELLRDGRFGAAQEVTVRVGANTGERCARTDPVETEIDVPADVTTGTGAHIHEIVGGHRFKVSATSFFQTRVDGAEALAHLVTEAVGPDRTVADLYSGVGLFTCLFDNPRQVYAVERGRTAAADCKVNVKGMPVHVSTTDVAKWKPKECDVVVADPSRDGLGKGGVGTLFRCHADRVVLVSCDAAAFARDIKLLDGGGYTLTSVTPVDLFPNTPHVEVVSVLDRPA